MTSGKRLLHLQLQLGLSLQRIQLLSGVQRHISLCSAYMRHHPIGQCYEQSRDLIATS